MALRTAWLQKRTGDRNRTQMHYARQGIITPEMEYVAQRENVLADFIRSEVARGRMVIPANVNHANLEPMAIGINSKCKINANIGNSAVTSNIEKEIHKLRLALKYGSDTVMDLSTGAQLDETRIAILENSPVPVGTVPIYQALEAVGGIPEELTADIMFDVIEKQAQQGVDYMTIHSGVLIEHLPLLSKRLTGIVSRGGAILAQWCLRHHKQNFLYTEYEEVHPACTYKYAGIEIVSCRILLRLN